MPLNSHWLKPWLLVPKAHRGYKVVKVLKVLKEIRDAKVPLVSPDFRVNLDSKVPKVAKEQLAPKAHKV